MLVALDRDTPQMKGGTALPVDYTEKELIMAQEPPWLWFTLPELGFPMITDKYRRPIHPEVEKYMRRYVTNEQDWEQVDDEDCWGMNYTGPTTEIKLKIESILHSLGGKHPEEQQAERKHQKIEKERFSVPHASRDPDTLIHRNLENEDIFEIIRNPPVRIFEKPEFWDTTHDPVTLRAFKSRHNGTSSNTPWTTQVPAHLGPTYNTDSNDS